MSSFERIILTLGIIFISLCAGYFFRLHAQTGRFSENFLDRLRHILQITAIFFLLPFSAMLSLWGLPHPNPSLFALPLVGLASYVWGGISSILLAHFISLNRKQTGSFYCCGTFTNIGAIGGLVCLVFLGENSIALVALYRLLEEIFYFGISFPVARWYGRDEDCKPSPRSTFRLNPVLIVILAALFTGMCLNYFGVSRPDFAGTMASTLMLAATVFFLFAIGLTLHLSCIWNYKKQGLAICVIKFIICPVVITGLAWLLGYGKYDNAIVLKAVAILSSMPVAMTALVPPSLFGLDVHMANACWLWSTGALLITLPVLSYLLPAL